jgi:hypothetical protein
VQVLRVRSAGTAEVYCCNSLLAVWFACSIKEGCSCEGGQLPPFVAILGLVSCCVKQPTATTYTSQAHTLSALACLSRYRIVMALLGSGRAVGTGCSGPLCLGHWFACRKRALGVQLYIDCPCRCCVGTWDLAMCCMWSLITISHGPRACAQ